MTWLITGFIGLLGAAISNAPTVMGGVPYSSLEYLFTVVSFGNFIIGADLMVYIFISLTAWWGFKASVGLVLWIYSKIPFIN